jgi:UrcA family protein
MFNHFKMFIIAAIVPLTAASFGHATPVKDSDLSRATVSLADLNLSTPAGVTAAHGRIVQAARAVCSQSFDENDWRERQLYRSCVDRATIDATASVFADGRMARNDATVLARR